uniref:Leucine-rich repeat-containing N-terminal plant-type domain-containing protein n=1 Tax=Amphora coffeiformis TaxID=265554 RepID=A0A7S3L5T5_9STRA|mmetsp:Transcript_10251/g.19677  ORF Transcript_10251/g.19677 Transcript_10251/m.19677 type:complete len:282 (+) Transcript_10251:116-961(+)|eukprot:scaffold8374_cov175-Amphora_coffeaeformis.AAC.116
MKCSESLDEESPHDQVPSAEEIKSTSVSQENQRLSSRAALFARNIPFVLFAVLFVGFLLGFISMTLAIGEEEEHSTAASPHAVESQPNKSIPLERRLQKILVGNGENLFLENLYSYQTLAIERIKQEHQVYAAYSDTRLKQVYGLLSFYFATSDTDWPSAPLWQSMNDECSWEGITCNTAHLVVDIDLSGFGLNGAIPLELILVESVRSIRLDDNPGLSGNIPSFLGRMKLDTLTLTGCGYVGEMPYEICQSKFDRILSILEVDCWDKIACDEICCENCAY